MIGWAGLGVTPSSVALVGLAVMVVSPAGSAVGATTAVSDNEAPLASAGLDQNVVVEETVFLDASGSRDPDGEIAGYEWEIETPSGGTVTPKCSDCMRTEFQVQQVGTYSATVTVTDDDGARHSDTARISVDDIDPPTVELSGPTGVTAGESYEYTATLTAGDHPLARTEWDVDGQSHGRQSVGGQAATDTVEVEFAEPGAHTVTVEGYDTFGLDVAETVTVDVSIPHGSRPCRAAVWNATSGAWDTGGCGNAPDFSNSDASGDGSTDSGVACSEYSSQGGPQGDREECDDDRLYWSHAPDDPVELYDGDSDGTIEYAGLDGTPEELAERYDGVEMAVGDGIRFEDAEAYREATGGVPPDTNPDAWYNEDPSLLVEATSEKDVIEEINASVEDSTNQIENLIVNLQNIDPENQDVEKQLEKQLGSEENTPNDESNGGNSGDAWWKDPLPKIGDNENNDDDNGGVVDTVVDTATDLIPGVDDSEDNNQDRPEDGHGGELRR